MQCELCLLADMSSFRDSAYFSLPLITVTMTQDKQSHTFLFDKKSVYEKKCIYSNSSHDPTENWKAIL